MQDYSSIFNISTEEEFTAKALETFKFQFHNNPVYRSFCDLLYIHPADITSINAIPFLPIEFFKLKPILSSKNPVEKVFKSSGTTGATKSMHYITNTAIYRDSFTNSFTHFYGPIEDYTILALLPSYLERSDASLVYMVDTLIKKSGKLDSGFYLNASTALKDKLILLNEHNEKVMLIGVSFALLDVIEQFQFKSLKNTIIMETGGMKGRRKELIREELHNILKEGFGVSEIHSEYGMTELLSQAYSNSNGIFKCPNWMKVLARDTEDPFTILPFAKSGGLNIIDLANINSCSFIATQDLGKVHPYNSFEVIGRFDYSDIRGCNLMTL